MTHFSSIFFTVYILQLFCSTVQLTFASACEEHLRNSSDNNSFVNSEYSLDPKLFFQQNMPYDSNISIVFTNNTQSLDQNDFINVYSNSELASKFDEDTWNRDCCASPNLYNAVYMAGKQPALLVTNNNDIGSVWLTSFGVKTSVTGGLGANLVVQNDANQYIEILPYQTKTILINVACQEPYNWDDYWTVLSINLTFSDEPFTDKQNVNVFFIYVCDQKFRAVKFAVTLAFLTIFLVVFVFIQAIHSTPLSIICSPQFRRFEIKYYHSYIYVVIMLGFAVITTFIVKATQEKFMDILMAIISFFVCWFYASELQCHFKGYHARMSKVLFKVHIFSFQLFDLVSCVVSAALIVSWLGTGKVWYTSDLLALCLLGSMMKLFKFKGLKQATLFLLICLIVDSVGALVVFYSQKLSYDAIFINDFNEPFIIAVPSWRVLYDKNCSWLPVTGTAFPGILINLCYRFDKSMKNVKTKAFTYIGSIGYILGSMIYILTTIFNIHTWPYSLINYPVMTAFIFLFAYKRGEHSFLWNGSFYDFDSARSAFVTIKTDQSVDPDDQSSSKSRIEQSQQIISSTSPLFQGLLISDSQPQVQRSINDISVPQDSGQLK